MDNFVEQVRDLFKSGEDKPFKPFAYYNGDGDEIEFFLTTDTYYGEWVNSHITIYRSEQTHEIIGGVISHIAYLKKQDNCQQATCGECKHWYMFAVEDVCATEEDFKKQTAEGLLPGCFGCAGSEGCFSYRAEGDPACTEFCVKPTSE